MLIQQIFGFLLFSFEHRNYDQDKKKAFNCSVCQLFIDRIEMLAEAKAQEACSMFTTIYLEAANTT